MPELFKKNYGSSFITPSVGNYLKHFDADNVFDFIINDITGGAVFSLSLLASSFAPVIEMLYVTLGFGTGFATSLLEVAVFAILPYYFEEKLGMATGVMQTGAGIGLLVFSALNAYLVDVYGLQGSFLILSGIALHAVPCGMLMKMPEQLSGLEDKENQEEIMSDESEAADLSERKPLLTTQMDCDMYMISNDNAAKHIQMQKINRPTHNVNDIERELLLKNESNEEVKRCDISLDENGDKNSLGNKSSSKLANLLSTTGLDLFKNKCYTLLTLATACIILSHKAVPTIMPDHILWTGGTKVQAANTLVYIGVANTLSRIFSWNFANKEFFRILDILTFSSFLSGISLVCTLLYSKYWMFVALSILYGITRGVYIIFYSLLLYLIVGKERAHHGYGVGATLRGVVVLIGMSSFGVLTDATYKTWGYNAVFMIIGGGEIVACGFLLAIRINYQMENKE